MNKQTALRDPSAPARFTAAEFVAMGEAGLFEGLKLELVKGELQRMPPPKSMHGQLQAALIIALGRWIAANRIQGKVGIDLGDDTIVGPDIAVLRAPNQGDRMIPAAEILLAIEIAVSTRRRDLDLKRHLYAEAGVPHLWVVDAERALVHVFDRPSGDDYLGFALVPFGEPLAVPGAAGTMVVG